MTQHTPITVLQSPKPQKSSMEPLSISLSLKLFPYLLIFVLTATLHTGSCGKGTSEGDGANLQTHNGTYRALWANRAPLPQRRNPIRWDRRWGAELFFLGLPKHWTIRPRVFMLIKIISMATLVSAASLVVVSWGGMGGWPHIRDNCQKRFSLLHKGTTATVCVCHINGILQGEFSVSVSLSAPPVN